MILTTQQQAQNFALWALLNSEVFDDLDQAARVAGLQREVCLVFGNHTFTDQALRELAEAAIAFYDLNY